MEEKELREYAKEVLGDESLIDHLEDKDITYHKIALIEHTEMIRIIESSMQQVMSSLEDCIADLEEANETIETLRKILIPKGTKLN